jgi:hypothetical protein
MLYEFNTTPGTSPLTPDVCIVGATPAGICAAIAAARDGASVVLTERTDHIGGLPANGLGATDIHLREATQGLFAEFVERNRAWYAGTYGSDSRQLALSKGGLHFEPSVAERTFEEMLAPWRKRITVLRNTEFDHTVEDSVQVIAGEARSIAEIVVRDRISGRVWRIAAAAFVDCTYEGDLMAAAGVKFVIGREGRSEFGESYAGVLYKPWRGEPDLGLSTGEGDDRLQAYNYRLCLTQADNRIPFSRPVGYDRSEYVSLIDDIATNRWTGEVTDELEVDTIGRVVNIIHLPNGKTDANNQHLSFISTDLPVENQRWPEASWEWRDSFAERLRAYTEGLLWFMASDSGVPRAIREAVATYGWPTDEYEGNGGFPRGVYVREARRMVGRYRLSQHDVTLSYPDGLHKLVAGEMGTPARIIHATSVASGCYAIDSHATRPREPGTPSLEGMYSKSVHPYTVPYEVMVQDHVINLLVPVAASATHVGFSTLRMEPVWMALGEAAGCAAALAVGRGGAPARGRDAAPVLGNVPIDQLQSRLLEHGATLVYDERLAAAGSDAERIALQSELLVAAR